MAGDFHRPAMAISAVEAPAAARSWAIPTLGECPLNPSPNPAYLAADLIRFDIARVERTRSTRSVGSGRFGRTAHRSRTVAGRSGMAEHEVAPWGHMTNWVPPEGETIGMNQVSVAAAVAAGLTFRPIGDTARDTVEWWNSLPEERRAQPGAGLPAEKEAEVLAAWAARG